MTGLRLRDGVLVTVDQLDENNLMQACEQGWCSYDMGKLTLSREGMLRLNALIPFLLSDSAIVK